MKNYFTLLALMNMVVFGFGVLITSETALDVGVAGVFIVGFALLAIAHK